MKIIPFEDLKVGQYVVMTRAGERFPGLAHRLFKVAALDDPYVAITTGSGAAATTHMIAGRDAEFAEPSAEMLSAIEPEEFALDAEYIGD